MARADDLILCSGTLLDASLRRVVEAAEAGGFRGISIWPHQVEADRKAGLSDRELRAFLDDHGVSVIEVEPILSWLPQASLANAVRPMVGAAPEVFLDLAVALGAGSVLACDGFGVEAGLEEIAESFAGLCDAAAQRGLRVKLEFLPWSTIPDAATAREVLRLADRSNAGIMIDTWHFFRGGADLSQIQALPGELVGGVQLNDAPAERVGDDLAEESMHHRLLPGRGAIPLVDLVRTLDAIGSRAPLGVEVFSDELCRLPPVEVGRQLGQVTRELLAKARG